MKISAKVPVRPLLLAVGWLLFCWLAMQAAHEAGHVLGARLTGTAVGKVVLNPLTFSRTETAASDFRTVIVWGGAIAGSLLPLVVWGGWVVWGRSSAFLFRFLAGFCLIANGAYVGFDFSTNGPTDGGELISLGVPRTALVLFGLAAVSGGLFLWNGQARSFGFGNGSALPARRTVAGVWFAALGLFFLELLLAF